MQAFRAYSEARKRTDNKKTELAKSSAAAALTAGQARDALAAFERLQSCYQSPDDVFLFSPRIEGGGLRLRRRRDFRDH